MDKQQQKMSGGGARTRRLVAPGLPAQESRWIDGIEQVGFDRRRRTGDRRRKQLGTERSRRDAARAEPDADEETRRARDEARLVESAAGRLANAEARCSDLGRDGAHERQAIGAHPAPADPAGARGRRRG